MESDNRPNAALINREWYESAKKVLSARDLSCVLVAAVEYVLYGDTAITLNDMARVVFAMVKPALDSDIAKYRERCARNAANARSQRQRVAASGTQSLPVGANTTTTTTTTSTTTSTTTPTLSNERTTEREKWLVYGYFWSSGSKAVAEECSEFWNYYESLGWKNNKGAAIVSRLAAARMWRRKYESGTAPNGSEGWFKVLQECPVADYGVWKAYAGAERNESGIVVRLRVSEQYLSQLREHMPSLERQLQAIWRAPAVTFELVR